MEGNSFEYGFYNSKADSQRAYNARQFSQMFEGIITPGIIPFIGSNFHVEKVPDTLQIELGTGKVWINNTFNYVKFPIKFRVEDPDPQYDRYDTLVLRIGCSELVRENEIAIITGEPGPNPVPPTLSQIDDTLYEYAIALILVKHNENNLNNAVLTSLVGEVSSIHYDNKFLIPVSSVLSQNGYGQTLVDVTTEDWNSAYDTEGGSQYYYKEMNLGNKIAQDAIVNIDIFIEEPSPNNLISDIQLKEDAFSKIFRYHATNGLLKLYAYEAPSINFKIRLTGKGILNA